MKMNEGFLLCSWLRRTDAPKLRVSPSKFTFSRALLNFSTVNYFLPGKVGPVGVHIHCCSIHFRVIYLLPCAELSVSEEASTSALEVFFAAGPSWLELRRLRQRAKKAAPMQHKEANDPMAMPTMAMQQNG